MGQRVCERVNIDMRGMGDGRLERIREITLMCLKRRKMYQWDSTVHMHLCWEASAGEKVCVCVAHTSVCTRKQIQEQL